jgi:SAM-dependent methyltransferase
LRQYIAGRLNPVPYPLYELSPPSILADVEGKDVLCLALGGGQQSAVFGLLGARVTVVDLAEGQLRGDREAAAHYGYDVTTVHADMRDLSCLADDSFDLVYGTATAYIPDVREVYSGVARILRTGGVFRIDLGNPAVYFVDWDSEGYRITAPYSQKVKHREDGAIEFRHYMADIFNPLIAEGFSIQGVYDEPHYLQTDPPAEPGEWTHHQRYVAGGFIVVARKN